MNLDRRSHSKSEFGATIPLSKSSGLKQASKILFTTEFPLPSKTSISTSETTQGRRRSKKGQQTLDNFPLCQQFKAKSFSPRLTFVHHFQALQRASFLAQFEMVVQGAFGAAQSAQSFLRVINIQQGDPQRVLGWTISAICVALSLQQILYSIHSLAASL